MASLTPVSDGKRGWTLAQLQRAFGAVPCGAAEGTQSGGRDLVLRSIFLQDGARGVKVRAVNICSQGSALSRIAFDRERRM